MVYSFVNRIHAVQEDNAAFNSAMRRIISLPTLGGWHTTKALSMAKAESKTAMLADGLRYKSKASGSPFAAAASFGGATMSCFLCGKHRTRSLMGTRKVLGKSQAVCAPSCQAMDEAAAG